jgi:hypothetical protein
MVALAVAGSIALPMPAFGQAVADRTLSDVRVEKLGTCTTLTVNFNIRLQILSSFPENSGRELHIRIRPLDAANATSLRESLRTPSSVPELRSIEYEADAASGNILSLFFTKDMRFAIEAGAQPQSMVIRLSDPKSGGACSNQASQPVMPAPSAPTSGVATPMPAPGVAIPAGLYAVNIVSQPSALAELKPAQKAAVTGSVIYETQFERDSQQWHRLRVGFFVTREAAEAAKLKLAKQFTDAWVVKVSATERAQGVAGRLNTEPPAPAAATAVNTAIASEVDKTDTAGLITEAEQAIKDGNNDRAIQLLTNANAKPENENTPRALELLGLTRERKGQNAHAQAEYEEYLRRYPTGEASDRVRQRLASLNTPSTTPTTPALREASGDSKSATAWTWGARGSFSQFYFRDQSKTKFVDASRPDLTLEPNNAVNVNQLLTSADLTLSGGNDRRQIQIRAAGSYSYDFRSTGRDIKSLTALYLDYAENDLNVTTRIGRQTRNSAGVFGRFDGGLLSWRAQPKLRFNVVGGFPVQSSRQTYVLTDRFFYGASADIGGRSDAIQTTVYWFDQRARGGFIDRRSAGIEARFLKSRFNAFSLLDYDVKFKKVNLGLLTLNYNFPDNSNFSVTADYRQSPLLTASNALIGQMDPLTTLPIQDLRGLRPFFTDAQIYQLAKDRTLTAKSLTVSYSRPITEKLQANVDFSMTDTGGTPASGGVDAMAATGKEYYYGAQLIGTGMLWSNDIYILSGRYSDTQRSRAYTADFNARVPVTSKFRISPRVRYGYRTDKVVESTFRQLQPTLRMNYYPVRHSEIEIEVGANFSRQRDIIATVLNTTTDRGFVVNAGYRIDF